MLVVGISIGALTVKAVALCDNATTAVTAVHQGQPLAALDRLLASPPFESADYFGVSGALGHLTEVAALQRAYQEIAEDYDVIASLGGESFLVYPITQGRIVNVFFAQQVCCRQW